jgi:hypothetical protein
MVPLKSLQVLQVRIADAFCMPSNETIGGVVHSCNHMLLLVFSLGSGTGEHIAYEFAEPAAFGSSDAIHVAIVRVTIVSIGMQMDKFLQSQYHISMVCVPVKIN